MTTEDPVSTDKPTVWQYLLYCYGKRLPPSMNRWVAEDLAGDGAVRRHMIRYAIPPLLILAPLWLLPAPIYMLLEMTAPIYVWALLMALALNKVWRRHRLARHGLDPKLVDVIQRKRDARMHDDYVRRFGPRPEDAKSQSNSSPF